MTTPIDPAADPPWPGPRTDGPGPDDAFPVTVSVATALGVMAWNFVAPIIVAIVFASAQADFDQPITLRVLAITSQITILVSVLWYLRSTGRLSWRLWGPSPPSSIDVPWGLGAGLGAFAIVLSWLLLYSTVFESPDRAEQALLEDVGASLAVTVLSFVTGAILAPIVEEFIHRALLFQALRRRLGMAPAVWLSATIFVAAHGELYPPLGSFQPAQLIALFLLGAWFAYLHHRSGSLAVPIIAHAVFNGINLALVLVGGG